MAKPNQNVVPHGDMWGVKKNGANRCSKVFDRKVDAEEFAKQVAKNQKAEVIIHGRNGRIQNTNSYGNDPCPPRDTKH